jgi:hypothetical protein
MSDALMRRQIGPPEGGRYKGKFADVAACDQRTIDEDIPQGDVAPASRWLFAFESAFVAAAFRRAERLFSHAHCMYSAAAI